MKTLSHMYFLGLDKLQENLEDKYIKWIEKQKMVEAMKEVYATNLFDHWYLQE